MNEVHDLTLILKSRFPLIVVETQEEARVAALLERICNLEQWPLRTWSVADGLRAAGSTQGGDSSDVSQETRILEDALRHVEKSLSIGVHVLFDAHPFLDSPINQRLVKEIALDHGKRARTLVFVGARVELPQELRRLCASFALTVPDHAQLREIFAEEARAWEQEPQLAKLRGFPEMLTALIQQVHGMTADDARRQFRQAIRDDGTINRADIERVLKFKHSALGGAQMLSLELGAGGFDHVGGQVNLKRWLDRRKPAFLGQIKGLDAPRGVLLLGVQGAGKSLAAKAIAASWGVSLLRLDVGALYSKWTGDTERNLRDSLKAAEAMAPCVLWLDEIEKGFTPDGGGGDGGVSRRVLGSLLTWMSEKHPRVFLAATANDISALPPELMRKGRFDEIFFVDLPDAATRADIFKIHLSSREQPVETFDLAALGAACDGFSGAEIEQAIVSGLYEAAAQGKALSTALLIDELARTRPLSMVMAERVAELREWARERTVPAN